SEAGLIETVPRQGYRLSQAPEPIPAASVIPQPEAPTLVLATATPGGGVSSPTRAGRSARWRLLVLVISVVILSGIVMISIWRRWSVRQQIRSLTSEGFRLVRQGHVPQIGQANLLFRRAIELNPNFAPAYAGLAEGMARSGEAQSGQ